MTVASAQDAALLPPGHVVFTSLENVLADVTVLEGRLRDQSGESAAAGMYDKRLNDIDAMKIEPWEDEAEYAQRIRNERAKATKAYDDAILAASKAQTADPALAQLAGDLAMAKESLAAAIFIVDAADFSAGSFNRTTKSWPIHIGVDIQGITYQSDFDFSISTADDIATAYKVFQEALHAGNVSARVLLSFKPEDGGWIIAGIEHVELMVAGDATSESATLATMQVQEKLFRVHPAKVLVVEPWVENPEVVFRIANGSEPGTLDPSRMESVAEGNISMALFEGLVTYDPKTGHAVPGLAESWAMNADNTQVTFKLRKANWSDGTPIKAQTVVDSWIRTLDPETGAEYAYMISMLIKGAANFNAGKVGRKAVGIRALDDSTFQCDLPEPMPYAVDMMAHYVFAVLPMHVIAAKGDGWSKKENIVTNGPYRLLEWKPQESITVVKNDTYWDARNVKLSTIIFLPIEDNHTAFDSYEAGAIDWSTSIPLELIDTIRLRQDYQVSPQNATYYYFFNISRKPFDDVRVRKALAMALDMQELVTKVVRGGQIATTSLVPPMAGYTSATGSAFNVGEARRLLAEAGYAGGKGFPRIPVTYNTNSGHKRIAEWVQESWKKNLGIEVTLINQEWSGFLDTRSRTHDFYIARAGWVGDYLDPNSFLEMFLVGSDNNDGLYANQMYDALVKKAATMKPGPERESVLQQAEIRLITKDQAIIPFYYYVSQDMINLEKWEGWYSNPLGMHNLKFVRPRARSE